MMDQKEKFILKGVSTEFLGEDQLDNNAISQVLFGSIQLVYISPESIMCNAIY
jgi:bloom syndrome protein